MSNLRIGILGGSFDPIHNGHLALARAACRKLGLSRLFLVPAAIPPHKRTRLLAARSHRLAMTRIAARLLREEGLPVRVDDGEISRPKQVSYTIDTVGRFRRRFGRAARIVLVMGSDSLEILHTWRRIGELLAGTEIAIGERPGFPAPRCLARARKRLAPHTGRFVLFPMRPDPASATAIRRSAREWTRVPAPISRYARRHALYTSLPRRAPR